MRGKEKGRRTHKVKSGITPAYAGKSAYLSPEDTAGRDHPRVCGEKYSWEKSTCKIFGSPPRMRGKVTKYVCKPQGVGITPAYAGKSCIYRSTTSISWDHPRVCGEKAYSLVINGSEWGSPPRMRGKGTKRCSSRRGGRITPAYAGKSKRIAPSSVLFGDHPRVCGEKLAFSAFSAREMGSPPRMRGKATSGASPRRAVGITPAYAGKSCKYSAPLVSW